jgi:hypothetical protein
MPKQVPSSLMRAMRDFFGEFSDVFPNEAIERVLGESFANVLEHLPRTYWTDDDGEWSGPTIPLHDALDNCGQTITDCCLPILFDEELLAKSYLAPLRRQLFENEARMNGLSLIERRRKAVPAPQERDEPPDKLCFLYFKDTPFLEFFNTPVPFKIPRDRWPTHAVIIAPSEWGKSELAGTFFREAVEDVDQRAVILCDPHGDLYKKALPRVSPERLIAIDLTNNPPDLNILDRSVMSDRAALQTFRFLMSSLAGGLTPKQENCIKPLFALLTKIEDANLFTLHQIVTEQVKHVSKSQFAKHISALPPVSRVFFENLWYSGNFSDTRDSLTWKIGAALDDPTFERMFTAKRNEIDVSRWIEERKVVLIKSGDQLDKEGTRLFFLFLIGQYYAAARRRDNIPEHQRHLAQMFVDEASLVLQSPIISDVLIEIRKYRCAFIAATQLWQHVAEEVRPAVLGSTGIRILGQLGHDEATALYRDMKVPLETISGLHNVPRSHAQWCMFVRSVTEKGIVVRAPYGVLEAMPEYEPINDDADAFDQFVNAIIDEAKVLESLHKPGPSPVDVSQIQRPASTPRPTELREPAEGSEPLIKPGKDWI